MRSDFSDPENTIIACKAGYNDDPHHGHLDCGNFILVWRGEQFISELGRGSYDEGYFQETRWDVPHASSEGHNVVFVNGAGQESAKHKDRPWQSGIGGEILDFRNVTSTGIMSSWNPTGAYPGTALGKWRRHIILDKPSVTVVLDEIAASPGSGIEIRFHSEATAYVLGEGFVFLDGEEGDMAIIPVAGVDHYAFRDGVHRFVEAQGLTAKLGTPREEPYFGIVFEAGARYGCRCDFNSSCGQRGRCTHPLPGQSSITMTHRGIVRCHSGRTARISRTYFEMHPRGSC